MSVQASGRNDRAWRATRASRSRRGHGLGRAAERAGVGGAGRVDRLGERLLDPATRVGHRLLEVVEPLVPEAQHLALGEAGRERHLREQREGRREARAGHLDVRAGAVPAGVRAELGPEPLGRLDERHAVARRRPLRHRAGEQDRGTRLGRVLARRAATRVAADDELRLEERPPGTCARTSSRPWSRRVRVNDGKWYGRGSPGDGSRVEDREPVGRDDRSPRRSARPCSRGGLGGHARHVRDDRPGVRVERLGARGADGLGVHARGSAPAAR